MPYILILLSVVYCVLTFLASPAFSEAKGWAATYVGVEHDLARAIQQTSDGGYIVAGGTRSFGNGRPNMWVLRLKPDGTIDWQRSYGGAGWDRANSIQQTADGGYIVAGYTNSFGAGGNDLWVLKLRPDGSIDPTSVFVRDTSVSGKDSGAVARNTRTARESNANPRNSSAKIQDTNVSASLLCP